MLCIFLSFNASNTVNSESSEWVSKIYIYIYTISYINIYIYPKDYNVPSVTMHSCHAHSIFNER